jgi:putative PEP-CTERM system TPR-repeat lipoprotein
LVSLQVRNKQYQEAMDVVRQVQKQNPKSAFGLSLEGDVLMAQNKFPEAIKVFESFHARAKTAGSLIKLHVAYAAAGKPEDGDARLAQWLQTSPGDTVVRYHAAQSALQRGKYKEAITHYELLQQKQPDNPQLLNNLSWAYFQVKDARALGLAERAYKLAPDSPSVADTLGVQLIAGNNVKGGIEVLEKAAKAAPNAPDIRFHLAQGYLKAGDKAKARGEIERALAINEKFSEHVEARNLLQQLRN